MAITLVRDGITLTKEQSNFSFICRRRIRLPPNVVPLQLRLSRPQLRSGRATRLHLPGWLQPPRPGDADAPHQTRLSIKAGLVIVDALSDLLSTTDSTGSSQPELFNLRRLADTCHAAALVIHHTNREGGYRGSSSIAASVDLMLEVTSPPTVSLIEIRAFKSRFQAPDPFLRLGRLRNPCPERAAELTLTLSGVKGNGATRESQFEILSRASRCSGDEGSKLVLPLSPEPSQPSYAKISVRYPLVNQSR